MMRIDAHQHFWKYSPAEYGWINDKLSVLKRDFMPGDLQHLLDQNSFSGSIAVQARQSLEETRFLLDLASRNDFIKGVVGWVDLCSTNLRKQLEELDGQKRLVGVRHVVQDEPDDEFMMRPEFRRGIAQLAKFGLVYDLLLFPRHLPVAVKLVREFPEQSFVLDHIAKPSIADGLLDPWRRDIKELANCSNVTCKLSGMVTEAVWKDWKPRDFEPYLDVVINAFGTGRLMIGSDWPVCTLSSDYSATIGLVLDYANQLSASEREGILGGNCARIYEIERLEKTSF
jgi:L-fuconolactonase